MKYTTASAFAMAAAGAAAQNSWDSWNPATSTTTKSPVSTTSTGTWSAWTTCPDTLTVVKTATTTAYQSTQEIYDTTVTIPYEAQPNTVSIKPEWAAWSSAAASTTKAPVYTLPSGCSAKTTTTSTTTSTSTITGTTTIHKSTLFLAVEGWTAPAGSSPTGGWSGGSSNGGGSGPSGGNSGGWNGGSSNGGGSGGAGGSWPAGSGTSGNGGGLVGGLPGILGDLPLPGGPGSNGDIFTYLPPPASHTHSAGSGPQYTQNPDGSWGGAPWGGKPIGDGGSHPWVNWPNGNNTGSNNTAPCAPGAPCSNVTKPFEPLQDGGCNSPGNRGTWCNGKSTSSDYYEDYFSGEEKHFTLVITNSTFNHDGEDVLTFLINGQNPGPAIEVNWGDRVTINVVNNLQDNGTAIHWHGVRQLGSNDQDGVPGITECPTAPGGSKTYSWIASSYGTSWYHSHWGVQYGEGVVGPIIIHGPATANYDVDAGPVVLTERWNQTAFQMNYAISHFGPLNPANWLMNGKNVVNDLSSGQHPLWNVQAGQKYLFRIVNAGTQQVYSLSIDQHTFTVIASDFVPITPYTTSWLNIGPGQRYDVVVDMNQAVGSYFFRAVTQTSCPAACDNDGLGQANGIIAYQGVPTSPYLLPTSTVNGNKTLADFNTCLDEPLASLSPFLAKPAGSSTSFQAAASTILGGGVTKPTFGAGTPQQDSVFQWFLNNAPLYINYTQPTLKSLNENIAINQTYHASNTSIYANHIVLEQKDQWYYFVIQNTFFASHPMHLHGHDMSILGQGYGVFNGDISGFDFTNPARRDTVMLVGNNPNIPGRPTTGGYTVIGFQSDNPGSWLMHCHIAWHIDGGLGVQWIERPDEIKGQGYNGDPNGECEAYAAYQSKNPDYDLPLGSSGLRRRNPSLYFDRMVAELEQHRAVVRRDGGAAHYLSNHLKRGLGDGSARRFGRRR